MAEDEGHDGVLVLEGEEDVFGGGGVLALACCCFGGGGGWGVAFLISLWLTTRYYHKPYNAHFMGRPNVMPTACLSYTIQTTKAHSLVMHWPVGV